MVDFGKVLGGAGTGFATGGIPGAIVGGLVGALASGGGNKSQTPETKPPQNASTNQKPQGTQTANSNQGTKNTGKSDPVEVAIKPDNTITAKGTDADKTIDVALKTKQAMEKRQAGESSIASSNNGASSQRFDGLTIQFAGGETSKNA